MAANGSTTRVLKDLALRRLVHPPGLSHFASNGLPPPSHDTTSAAYHVTQASFLLQLDLAVQASWAARHRSKYVDVKVLLMTWQSDDLGVEREAQALLSVFRDLYRFDCEYWQIPDRDSAREATKKVIAHMERASSSPDNLFIFYYAGHASPNPHFPGGLPTWVANRTPSSPKFDSSCIQPHLCHVDDGSPDVLLLYDSCYPANGQGPIESSKAVIELLAACGFEARAPEVGRDSFTYSLIQELASAAGRSAGISMPELHRRLICRLQSWKPNVLLARDDAGKTKVCLDKDGVPIFEPPVRRTPIHCQLSLNDRPRAIVLSPLPAPANIQEDFIDLSRQGAASSAVGVSAGPSSTATETGAAAPRIHALLRVSLVEDEFHEAEFRDWLCSAPEAAKSIKVLGVLPSCSTMLLIQVPVDVWDLLPASPAVAFVGFVRDTDTDTTARFASTATTQSPTANDPALAPTSFPKPAGSSCSERVDAGRRDKGKDRVVGFQLSQTADEKSLVEVLDLIDRALPRAFQRMREMAIPPDDRVSFAVQEVLNGQPEMAHYDDVISQPQHMPFIRRYISARDLLEVENPVLDLPNRLSRLTVRHNFDIGAHYTGSTASTSHPSGSSLRRGLNTLATASASGKDAMGLDAFDPLQREFEALRRAMSDSKVPTPPQKQTEAESEIPKSAVTPISSSGYEDLVANSSSGYRSYLPRPLSGTGDSISTDERSYPCSFDTSKPPELPLGSDAPRPDTPVPGPSFLSEDRCFPALKPPSLQDEDPRNPIEYRFKFHQSHEFRPGRVLKMVSFEPRKGSPPAETLSEGFSLPREVALSVRYRRFVVIANDEGYCTCVPISTYSGQACKKHGVKPAKHGIVFETGRRPRLLPGEPELGFPPVQVRLTEPGERFAKESRVNYAKLTTIEHNMLVYFIGEVVEDDLDIILSAVDLCWAKRRR